MLAVLVSGRSQFVDSKFEIYGGFGYVRSSILVDKPGVQKGSKFGFSRFGSGFRLFLARQVQSSGFLKGFEVQFWWTNLGLSEFEVRPVKFKAVRSSLYLGSIQH